MSAFLYYCHLCKAQANYSQIVASYWQNRFFFVQGLPLVWDEWMQSNELAHFGPRKLNIKRGCVFPMVIWPAFRMGQYRVNDHPYHAPQFKLMQNWHKKFSAFWEAQTEIVLDKNKYFRISLSSHICEFDRIKARNGYLLCCSVGRCVNRTKTVYIEWQGSIEPEPLKIVRRG